MPWHGTWRCVTRRQRAVVAAETPEWSPTHRRAPHRPPQPNCRKVVKDHLLALRWMNPNAVVYLREAKGQGTPAVEYTLWTEGGATTHSFEVKGSLTPEDVVAKVMMASRDPALGDAPDAAAAPAAGAATGAAAAAAAAAASGGPAPAAPARPAVVSPLTSAPYTGADYPGRLA